MNERLRYESVLRKKDFYTAKMPINAVITALSKEAWCLVGV